MVKEADVKPCQCKNHNITTVCNARCSTLNPRPDLFSTEGEQERVLWTVCEIKWNLKLDGTSSVWNQNYFW